VGCEDIGRKLGIGTRVAGKILRERARNGAAPRPSAGKAAAAVKTPPAAKVRETPTANARETPPNPPRNPEPRPAAPPPQAAPVNRRDPRTTARNATRGAIRGTRQFGRGFWKSFGHAAHALSHEISGVFFALFAAFFAQCAWEARSAWIVGPEHRHFWIYVVVASVFLYFSVSSFVRSRRKVR
jgi:hypothetical protein